MSLRINTNLASIRALRNLGATDRSLETSLERLSTGLRINRASDDPSGLVISEQLRGQISGLKQASENTQTATNMIGTADAALQQVSDLLNSIRQSAIFALNTGASSPDQVAAEQASVDQAIAAINRIAQTTRFGDGALLNGSKGYDVTATDANVSNLDLRRLQFAPGATSRTVTVGLTTIAERATRTGIGAAGLAGATLRVTGELGSREIVIAASATAAQVGAAINTVAQETGVYSDGVASVFSDKFGSDQFINVELTAGAVAGLAAGSNTDTGVDAIATFNGNTFTGKGLHLSINTGGADFSFDFLATTVVGAYAFTSAASGVNFQVNETGSPNDRISLGIADVSSSKLGFATRPDDLGTAAGGVAVNEGGFLASLQTGGANDLTKNPGNALKIIDAATTQITGIRGFLGAIQSFNLQPNLNNLEVSIENITAAESSIRDLNFAEETTTFTRNQVLYQAGVAVLGSANLLPQTVLTLLK